jgi:hypothetical protein
MFQFFLYLCNQIGVNRVENEKTNNMSNFKND